MGHKDLRATAVYVEQLSMDEKKICPFIELRKDLGG